MTAVHSVTAKKMRLSACIASGRLLLGEDGVGGLREAIKLWNSSCDRHARLVTRENTNTYCFCSRWRVPDVYAYHPDALEKIK